ncbi:MAG TPA: hypothetical protein PLK36_06595 [Methanoregulaceae archaeon]|mgnify:FL=1|nr:hypothetical protein [Methanoregulaceae archaeon]HQN89729.1 hypothetical protein [Methanoregulaceae archaeon]HQP82615.1 hypothetical protein [Methanoregulaceae archaeon]
MQGGALLPDEKRNRTVNDKCYGTSVRKYPGTGLIKPCREGWISAVDKFVTLPGKTRRALCRIRLIVIDNDAIVISGEQMVPDRVSSWNR